MCGASLITARLAATAFHCVTGRTNRNRACDHRSRLLQIEIISFSANQHFMLFAVSRYVGWIGIVKVLPSDGKRYVVLGAHYDASHQNHRNTAGQKIPVIDALAPPDAGYIEDDTQSHDFAMLVLKFPAHFSSIGKNLLILITYFILSFVTVSSICLPNPHEEFPGKRAVAAGTLHFYNTSAS